MIIAHHMMTDNRLEMNLWFFLLIPVAVKILRRMVVKRYAS